MPFNTPSILEFTLRPFGVQSLSVGTTPVKARLIGMQDVVIINSGSDVLNVGMGINADGTVDGARSFKVQATSSIRVRLGTGRLGDERMIYLFGASNLSEVTVILEHPQVIDNLEIP